MDDYERRKSLNKYREATFLGGSYPTYYQRAVSAAAAAVTSAF